MSLNPIPSSRRQRDARTDRLGVWLAHCIDQAPVDPSIEERLRVARLQALAAAAPHITRLGDAPPRRSAWWSGQPHAGARWWNVLAVTAGVAAFAVSMVVVQRIHDVQEAAELAEVDTELLTDDIPPTAYSDPAFMQFLRNTANANVE